MRRLLRLMSTNVVDFYPRLSTRTAAAERGAPNELTTIHSRRLTVKFIANSYNWQCATKTHETSQLCSRCCFDCLLDGRGRLGHALSDTNAASYFLLIRVFPPTSFNAGSPLMRVGRAKFVLHEGHAYFVSVASPRKPSFGRIPPQSSAMRST